MSNEGLSREGLQRLDHATLGFVQRGEVPGAAYAVSRDGQLHVGAVGTLSAGGARGAVQRDTIFRIASLTKPITAVATLMLVEDGKLQLDEPVDRLLPELRARRVLTRPDGPLSETVPAARPITPRDLLTFCFGLGQMLPDGPLAREAQQLAIGMGPPAPNATPAPDEWLRRLGSLPLAHQPGERWQYNTGSDVLGVLIARASGLSFGTFLQERIFQPLGMRETAFSVPEAKLERFADSYMPDVKGELVLFDRALGGQWSRPPAFESGAGGLCSTVDDYLAFAHAMLHEGEWNGVRLISRASFHALSTDQLRPQQKRGATYTPGYFETHGWGFGVGVTTAAGDPAEPAGTFGWYGGLGSSWHVSPRERMTCVYLSQRSFTSPEPPSHIRDFAVQAHAALT